MRSSKFYIVFLLLLNFHAVAYELEANGKCYEAEGRVVYSENKSFFYINYEASSEKSLKIQNAAEFYKSPKQLKSFKAYATFKVIESCDFQCNIELLSVKILPPFKRIDPVAKVSSCKP